MDVERGSVRSSRSPGGTTMEISDSPGSMASQRSQPKLVHRRRHMKSRNGCLECKKRKVKCDESPNSCGACLKRGTRCSFRQATPTPSPHSQFSGPFPVSSLQDLELLHNYSTKTAFTMTFNTSMRHFHQTDFITAALKCDYFLHCLLGLSAFHLVSQHHELLQEATEQQIPEIQAKIDDYLLAASFHHNAGLSLFRQDISHITEQNCHDLFATAVLVFMSSFAESCEGVHSITNARSTLEEESAPAVTKWLILLRGAKTVVMQTWKWVELGPMAPIIAPHHQPGYHNEILGVNEEAAAYLDSLCGAFTQYSEPNISLTCIAAIEFLRRSWAGINSGADFGVAFLWAVSVDDEFIALLESKTPEALLVLGAYGVLLHTNDWAWWMRGWPKHTLRLIEGMMDERWRGWLEWPVKMIRHEKVGQWKRKFLVVTEGRCC